MHDQDTIQQLARVKRLEPPPFLFTRIEARLATAGQERVPRSWMVASVSLAILLVLLNVSVLRGWSIGRDAAVGADARLMESMGLEPANQLYQ
jgi:hypothetical protein